MSLHVYFLSKCASILLSNGYITFVLFTLLQCSTFIKILKYRPTLKYKLSDTIFKEKFFLTNLNTVFTKILLQNNEITYLQNSLYLVYSIYSSQFVFQSL